MSAFFSTCMSDGNNITNPIRNKVQTFLDEKPKKTVVTNKSLSDLQHERDLMGRIIHLAMENNIDLKDALSHPLTLNPPSLATAMERW